jgi:hypothetical protein
MANDPPFATLNHFAADLGIPSESDLLRIGITPIQGVTTGTVCCEGNLAALPKIEAPALSPLRPGLLYWTPSVGGFIVAARVNPSS